MANVVLVSKHQSMCDNGFDSVFGMSASDILAFSNMDKAIAFVEEQIAIRLKGDDSEGKFDKYTYTKAECLFQGVKEMIVYAQVAYNGNGVRTAYRIVKQSIN